MVPCPVCEAKSTSKILDWKRFTINRCGNCSLLFANPMPDEKELMEFYQGFMFKVPASYEIKRQLKRRESELQRLFSFPDSVQERAERKFLDYGGGTGVVFKAVTNLGLDAYYQDLDEQAIAFTKKHFGLSSSKMIRSLADTDLRFDYILSDNVIEHVPDPISFVEELMQNLDSGGELVIKTPRGGNLAAYFNPNLSVRSYLGLASKYNPIGMVLRAYFKRFWHCDPPRHLYSFTDQSMHELMSRLETNDFTYELDAYQSIWLNNTITRQFFSRDKQLSGWKSVVVRIVVFPVIPFEFALQVLRKLLVTLGVIKAGGLILRIKRVKAGEKENRKVA